MPLITKSSYPKPPFYYFNGHAETIFPDLFKKKDHVHYERERLELSDGDFVDLDWLDQKSRKLVILSHGLEGDSQRPYIQRAARFFTQQKWAVLAWNCRSCSGEMNRKLRLYNHGEIEDIGEVIAHVLSVKDYEEIILVGYSMGGSILLKYLGVNGKEVPEPVRKGIAFSTPCDIAASISAVEKPANRMFKYYFMSNLRTKIEEKAKRFPDQIDVSKFKEIKVWKDFDNWFSAPLNGYQDADEFYYAGSAKNFMGGTDRPALIVNAQNDPILLPSCSPKALCESHPNLFLETPRFGGHVGFTLPKKSHTWMEERAWEFVN